MYVCVRSLPHLGPPFAYLSHFVSVLRHTRWHCARFAETQASAEIPFITLLCSPGIGYVTTRACHAEVHTQSSTKHSLLLLPVSDGGRARAVVSVLFLSNVEPQHCAVFCLRSHTPRRNFEVFTKKCDALFPGALFSISRSWLLVMSFVCRVPRTTCRDRLPRCLFTPCQLPSLS